MNTELKMPNDLSIFETNEFTRLGVVYVDGTIDGPMGTFYLNFADARREFIHQLVARSNAYDELMSIAKALSLLTDEGDDQLHGCYAKDCVIRAKGSTLDLIERARALLLKEPA